ncbi:MAG: DNA-binding protein [Chitinophagaceae bacterium]
MEVICLQKEAFYSLVDKVIAYVKEQTARQDKWLNTQQAMAMLHIKSKSTLQKLRDESSIRFAQPKRKWIVMTRIL